MKKRERNPLVGLTAEHAAGFGYFETKIETNFDSFRLVAASDLVTWVDPVAPSPENMTPYEQASDPADKDNHNTTYSNNNKIQLPCHN